MLIVVLVCVLIGYIFGLFQTGYFIGKLYKTDIRKHGSGNAGSTNVLRTFGKKAGILTLIGDFFKCVFAILLVKALFKENYPDYFPLLSVYTAVGCVLAHNFPCTLGFKGGKGIASSAGMLLAVDIRVFLICTVVYVAVFYFTHIVSFTSLVTYVSALISFVFLGAIGAYSNMAQNLVLEMDFLVLFMTALAFYRHKDNIKRLIAGKEKKIYF